MKHLLSLLIISMITGCSTLNFWSSEEEDLEEPRPLQRIENLFKLDRIWSRGFNSDNSLGNYRIAFDGDEIIITNEDGDIFNINKFNGKVNNKYESLSFKFNLLLNEVEYFRNQLTIRKVATEKLGMRSPSLSDQILITNESSKK